MTFHLNADDDDLPDPPTCPLCAGKLIIVPAWVSNHGIMMVTVCAVCHWLFDYGKKP